jgi:2-polyprenyl-3-methyl-5-hydroxy-6-metoxy-1,4-benzoquinol methylase
MHTVSGAKSAINTIFGSHLPQSVLDVGCGLGTWLAAFSELGVGCCDGIDGDWVERSLFMLPPEHFHVANLNYSFDLGRKYELVVCLEVAEHISMVNSNILIESLCNHSDLILFSAAPPRQPGENHINLHYPEYWQTIFESQGFHCDDSVRWKIWNDTSIECWYR